MLERLKSRITTESATTLQLTIDNAWKNKRCSTSFQGLCAVMKDLMDKLPSSVLNEHGWNPYRTELENTATVLEGLAGKNFFILFEGSTSHWETRSFIKGNSTNRVYGVALITGEFPFPGELTHPSIDVYIYRSTVDNRGNGMWEVQNIPAGLLELATPPKVEPSVESIEEVTIEEDESSN